MFNQTELSVVDIVLVFVVLAFLLLWQRERQKHTRESALLFAEREDLLVENYDLRQESETLLDYAYGADDYSVDLASYADLHDALLDAQNEVKMLKSQTVELPEVKPTKRTTRAKKGSTT